MFSNRLAVALLGVACITAAGAGGYFAARQNAVPAPVSAQLPEAPLAPVADASASKPVQETEAVVGDAAKPSSAPAPVAPVAPAPVTSRSTRRAEAAPTPAPPPSRRASTSAPVRERTSARNDPAPLANTWPSSASQSPSTPIDNSP